ncbi:hypothetical protein SK128_012085, partial [Halocaridina rubra]
YYPPLRYPFFSTVRLVQVVTTVGQENLHRVATGQGNGATASFSFAPSGRVYSDLEK